MGEEKYKKCINCGMNLIENTDNFRLIDKNKMKYKNTCKKCEKEYQKAYREKNKEKNKEYNKKYYQDNREELLKKSKDYHEAHKEEKKDYLKQYYQDNKEKLNDEYKRYREEHKDELKKYFKKYREEHKDEKRAYFFNRAAKERYVNDDKEFNTINTDEFLSIYDFFDNKCAYSGEELNESNRTIDHIIPLNLGGTNDLWNLVPCHRRYNSSKCDNKMEDWYRLVDCFSEERLEKIYEWITINGGSEYYDGF